MYVEYQKYYVITETIISCLVMLSYSELENLK